MNVLISHFYVHALTLQACGSSSIFPISQCDISYKNALRLLSSLTPRLLVR